MYPSSQILFTECVGNHFRPIDKFLYIYSLLLEYFDRKCHIIYNRKDKQLFKHLCFG
nr:MAG TPA: hypothetical protein [Caudoviricetes sp.]